MLNILKQLEDEQAEQTSRLRELGTEVDDLETKRKALASKIAEFRKKHPR